MTTAYWRCKERLYSNCGLKLGLEKQAVLIQVIYNQHNNKSFRETEKQRYENLENTVFTQPAPASVNDITVLTYFRYTIL